MKRESRLLTLIMILTVMLVYMPAYLADELYVEAATGQWQKTGSGTQYYAEFPSGYYKSSSLYGKYNRGKLSPYENVNTKREVTTTRVSFIYWHWTWNASVPTEQNNKLIDDKQGYDGQHDYQYFTDFESTEDYPLWSGDNRVHEYWRNRPEDGSKWWFRIPVYKQTYTDYKYVASDDSNDKTNNDNINSTNTNTSAKNSNKTSVKKNTPKKTSVNKCRPKKKSCSLGWKKCSGKCTGYQIRYCTNKNFKGCKTRRIKGRSNCSCSLTGLKAGTIYYYQIRCYRVVNKKTCCSKWSKCKSFKTKSKPKARSTTKSRYMPTEFDIKYAYPHEGVDGLTVKVNYNKRGLITSTVITCRHDDGFSHTFVSDRYKYTQYSNKGIKTVRVYNNGRKKPYLIISFNKYGAITTMKRGHYNIEKGTPTYYKGTHKLKVLKMIEEDYDISLKYQYTFDKNGYIAAYNTRNQTQKFAYDKKGHRTKVKYRDGTTTKYKYKIINGRVSSFTKSFPSSSGGHYLDKTVTIKKWKKIKISNAALRSVRCMASILEDRDGEDDHDAMIPLFAYEWK